MKKLGLIIAASALALAACGSEENEATTGEPSKDIKLGATAGPYSDMLKQAIVPGLEEKGYTVDLVEFSDYIQPNIALDGGDIDANLFQHSIYLENFEKENNMDLSGLIVVPTAPMGIYSNQFDTLDDIEDGATIAIPNDPVNAARALQILEDQGLVEVDPEVDDLKISERDVITNKKNLVFQPIEAGQLPRAVEGSDLSAVPGNFALAAEMDLLDALALENMPDQYRNLVAVKAENEDSELAKDIIEIVESEEFEKVIDENFEGFGKPQWMTDQE
ncbi:MAG: MetQ/NlpA family ABC transporter substrate-binding protein [Planococcus sp. (in: firmicutes)]|uniref:MetQ/NlpA family ABC transporter substrate-binding protein n=1 Tax=Planococcus halocryophilus TaxID=1215089 RepID=UPI001F0FE2E4|nr:MetQ/NlpA family ABC transporter substrate-binding protein [Planococcus halocryophilus]MCH4825960.1 MetQ/NlpA family ABC transporter substrate-binding protein [Planococcus halocryophilus]